jgi:signal transduction histidine kinase
MQRLARLFPIPVSLLVRSIRFRLALWFVMILAAVLLVFSGFVYARQSRDLNRETLDRLSAKTRKLESYLKYGAPDYFEKKRSLSSPGAPDEEPLLQENDILALIGLEGQVVQKAGPISEMDIQQVATVGIQEGIYNNPFSYTVVEASTGGQLIQEKYLFVVAPISFDHTVIGSLVLGSPVDPTGQMDRLLFTLILGNLAMLGIALVGGYWLADRAMRPVQMITRTAREIGETDLSRRLNLGTQDELGELAGTFDQMLARLQAAFDRQRQFTADASHELRTPLTIVNLEASRALATRRTPQEYQRALAIIQSENEFMTRLVNNLLILSRMDAGQAVLNLEVLDLSDVVFEVVERLTPLAERRGVILSTGELPELKVSGDRQYLSQLVANLVENAIKHSRGAGQRVQVETGFDPGKLAGQPAYGWVRVEDNGPGIAPEHLSRIFDRFYQVDRVRSHNADELGTAGLDGQPSAGSGLGLSIVQRITHAHGGEVSVKSEVNQGSVFSVSLPLVDSPDRAGENKDNM